MLQSTNLEPVSLSVFSSTLQIEGEATLYTLGSTGSCVLGQLSNHWQRLFKKNFHISSGMSAG